MFGGVKITLIICLTIITSCVLFISYNEYSNRYTVISTPDNSIYIFDKKSTILNKCDGKNCKIIETKLPSKTMLNQDVGFQQSKLFETEKTMATATLETSASKPEAKEPTKSEDNNAEATSNDKSSSPTDSEKTEKNTKAEAEQSKTSEENSNTEQDSDKKEGTDKQTEEEFVE